MFYVNTIVIPLFLLALAVVLLLGHWRSWRDAKQDDTEQEELDFGRRQFRRLRRPARCWHCWRSACASDN